MISCLNFDYYVLFFWKCHFYHSTLSFILLDFLRMFKKCLKSSFNLARFLQLFVFLVNWNCFLCKSQNKYNFRFKLRFTTLTKHVNNQTNCRIALEKLNWSVMLFIFNLDWFRQSNLSFSGTPFPIVLYFWCLNHQLSYQIAYSTVLQL